MCNHEFIKTIILCSVLTILDVQAFSDPTRPANYIEPEQSSSKFQAKSEPMLNAIFLSNTNKLAVIDGKLFKDGEHFEAATVKIVDKYHVRLINVSGEKLLTLFNKIIKDCKSCVKMD